MTMRVAIALVIAAPGLCACTSGPPVTLEGVRAGTLGESDQSAIEVQSVEEEYEIVRKAGFEPVRQALAPKGSRAFDVLTVRDPVSGEQREIWFDITSFYGRF